MRFWWLVGVAVWLLLGIGRGGAEDITLTTYYPSPRGVYDELQANTLVLKDRSTGSTYSLTMNAGRLLITDTAQGRTFMIIELPVENK